ncbi:MAG: hypothetical protein AUK63_2113 [bacterium P3]|nr:MAG: hypothetical protein AUK63_2113 [bacterium P3]KWW32475.1 MAG: hypothetical protein F083_2665 [bacterium F083]
MALPLAAGAQTKVKETAVPQSVLLALEKTYESYKVKTWYQATGQYIAELVVDGQHGRAFFTATGDWQYSTFPVKVEECPTLMNTYFVNNYPGYRIRATEYVEEMNGDNYYRLTIQKKGLAAEEYEMIFDTRGKLLQTNAPDPDEVKRDYYTHNNPDEGGSTMNRDRRPRPVVDNPVVEKKGPTDAIVANFTKRYPPTRLSKGPEWVARDDDKMVAYYSNNQGAEFEAVYSLETQALVMTGKVLSEERYTSAILKYLKQAFRGEKYEVEKMVVYEYDAKYRGVDGKKPKPYTYVVVSQKQKGGGRTYTRMEFDNTAKFVGLLAQPLDEKDIQ